MTILKAFQELVVFGQKMELEHTVYSSITHLYVITVMPLVPGRNSSPASVASVEETEDNLVLDFSNGGPPSLVISTADQPQVRLPF